MMSVSPVLQQLQKSLFMKVIGVICCCVLVEVFYIVSTHVCMLDFRHFAIGEKQRSCLGDGQWDGGNFVCEGMRTTLPFTMFYSILPHFKLLLWIGYEEPWYNSKCSLLSTVWTLLSLSLSPVVKCEPPKPIPNGQPRPPVNEMYEYGQAVQYVCNGDNTMLGASDTVHCLENGSWSDVPRCASKLGSSVGLSWLYWVPQGASMLGGLVIACANFAVNTVP